MQEAEPTAYGILHLLPWDFGRMTPGEFRSAMDGFEQHQRAEMRRSAWIVANMINGINPQKDTVITVDDLLPDLDRQNRNEPHESPREAHEKLKREFEQRLGRRL